MENSAWTPVAVRLFAFSVLPVLPVTLQVRFALVSGLRLLERSHRPGWDTDARLMAAARAPARSATAAVS